MRSALPQALRAVFAAHPAAEAGAGRLAVRVGEVPPAGDLADRADAVHFAPGDSPGDEHFPAAWVGQGGDTAYGFGGRDGRGVAVVAAHGDGFVVRQADVHGDEPARAAAPGQLAQPLVGEGVRGEDGETVEAPWQ